MHKYIKSNNNNNNNNYYYCNDKIEKSIKGNLCVLRVLFFG
jgi:hypothetical protein